MPDAALPLAARGMSVHGVGNWRRMRLGNSTSDQHSQTLDRVRATPAIYSYIVVFVLFILM